MKKIKINLSLKILPEDQTVVMIRPGSNYHLYNQFLINEVVSPDVPFLTATDGENPIFQVDIEQQLARAVAYRTWQKKSKKERENPPSKDLESYKVDLDASMHSRTRLFNVTEKILWELPEGTVVFVPASSLYGEAIVGELASREDKRVTFSGEGYRQSIKYLGRRLNNIKTFPMRNFPVEVTDVAKSPSVVQEYHDYAKERILRSYYGDYQLGSNVAMMEFEALKDKFDPITMARITALAASIEHYERTGNYVSPGDIIFSLAKFGNLEVHANINSKNGKLLVEGVRKVPHVLRALLLAATLVVSGEATADDVAQMLETGSLEVHNDKEAAKSEYIQATETSLVNFSKAAGFPTTKAYIEALAESATRTSGRVDGDAKVE